MGLLKKDTRGLNRGEVKVVTTGSTPSHQLLIVCNALKVEDVKKNKNLKRPLFD